MSVFNRPPRIQKSLPDKTIRISIPAPSGIPLKPVEGNLVITALPIVAIALVTILLIFGSSSVGLSYLLFMPLMLAAYFVSLLNTRIQRRKYEEDLAITKEKYNTILRETARLIQQYYNREKEIRYSAHPSPSDCYRIAKNRQSRLGERRITDPDFLNIRLGLGQQPVLFEIERPDSNATTDEFEEEYQFIDGLFAKYSSFQNAPIVARIPQKGSIGFAGKRSEVLDVVRAFVSQIVTHHWYTEVQVAAICKPSSFSDWKWLQDLPHMSDVLRWRNKDLFGEEHLQSLMVSLEEEIQRREQLVESKIKLYSGKSKMEASDTLFPRTIVIFDSLDIEYNHPGLTLLLNKGMDLGIYGVFISQHAYRIPGSCGAVVRIKYNTLLYQETGIDGIEYQCHQPDRVGYKQADALAQALASIQWADKVEKLLPAGSSVETIEVEDVDELPIQKWWTERSPDMDAESSIRPLVNEADLVVNLDNFKNWLETVASFMSAVLGESIAKTFLDLYDSNYVEALPKMKGYLLGLTAKLDKNPEISNDVDYSLIPKNQTEQSSSVFIVHGHDVSSKQTVARFVEKLGLNAIILHEQPERGRTIIEKLEHYSDVGFAIVLLSPDDLGATSGDRENLIERARQNVVFELGYFIARLGRDKVSVLCIGKVEIPSDYYGVIYIDMDDAGAWQLKLIQELKAAGLDVQSDSLFN